VNAAGSAVSGYTALAVEHSKIHSIAIVGHVRHKVKARKAKILVGFDDRSVSFFRVGFDSGRDSFFAEWDRVINERPWLDERKTAQQKQFNPLAGKSSCFAVRCALCALW
jgi:hypothetical protein